MGRLPAERERLISATVRRAATAAAGADPQARVRSFTVEYGENTVADQFQNVAPLLINRGNDRAGIIVEQRNNLSGSGRVADPCVAAPGAKPQYRFDLVG